MNKKLVWGIGIAIVIIVGVYLSVTKIVATFSRSQDEKLVAVEEALFRKNILQIAILYEEWYSLNNSNYSGFLDNADNAKKMNDLIAEIKSHNINAFYYTHANKDTFVIKIRREKASQFYCFDAGDLEAKLLNAEGENYKSQTTCGGDSI